LADADSDVWLEPRRLSSAFNPGNSLAFDPANCPKPLEPGSDESEPGSGLLF
jgi:hypothetical protein